MTHMDAAIKNDGDDEWAERGDYWLKQVNPALSYNDSKRRHLHLPLILSGHGVRLKVDRGTLLIQCGYTHYPQKQESYRYFPRDRRLPSRIVVLDGDGSVTFDALEWLAAQNVALIQLNWRGEVVSVGGANYAADPELVRQQLEIQHSPKSFEFAKYLIHSKIKNTHAVIERISENSPAKELALKQLQMQIDAIKNNSPANLSALLGIEGIAASAYFRYWQSITLQWKGNKPIPDDWRRMGSRIGDSKTNNYARHPVNTMLNYVYGILEIQVRTQLLAMGLDPMIGYIHKPMHNRQSLVYDLMEPVRPIMDARILEFVRTNVFSPSDFIVNKVNGVCRLHPQCARVIVKLVQDIEEVETITAANIKRLFSTKLNTKKQLATNKSVPLKLV